MPKDMLHGTLDEDILGRVEALPCVAALAASVILARCAAAVDPIAMGVE